MYKILTKLSSNYAIVLTLFIIVFQAITVVFIKFAAIEVDTANPLFSIFNFYYLLSLVFFGLRAFFWQIVLIKNPISKYYPVLSLNYLAILILSVLIFNEKIDAFNILGVVAIIFGIYKLTSEE